MNRNWLLEELGKYSSEFEEEQQYVSRFIDLLSFSNCYERSLLSGHFTASAWVMNPEKDKVLLLHHKKLDKWLQPGGHADGEVNLPRVAKKEVEEETGISDIDMIGDTFFDIDIHVIPERKGVPQHEHYDLRFAMIAQNPAQLKKNHESNEVAWIELSQIEDFVISEPSIMRMKNKAKFL